MYGHKAGATESGAKPEAKKEAAASAATQLAPSDRVERPVDLDSADSFAQLGSVLGFGPEFGGRGHEEHLRHAGAPPQQNVWGRAAYGSGGADADQQRGGATREHQHDHVEEHWDQQRGGATGEHDHVEEHWEQQHRHREGEEDSSEEVHTRSGVGPYGEDLVVHAARSGGGLHTVSSPRPGEDTVWSPSPGRQGDEDVVAVSRSSVSVDKMNTPAGGSQEEM